MSEITKKVGEELANWNSKKLAVAVVAGYVLRDMAISQVAVEWYYPACVSVISITYLVLQFILDKNEK